MKDFLKPILGEISPLNFEPFSEVMGSGRGMRRGM
jgi:hypothetical protein